MEPIFLDTVRNGESAATCSLYGEANTTDSSMKTDSADNSCDKCLNEDHFAQEFKETLFKEEKVCEDFIVSLDDCLSETNQNKCSEKESSKNLEKLNDNGYKCVSDQINNATVLELKNIKCSPLKRKTAIINDTLVEPKIQKFACKICSATLSCDYNLKRHISEVHKKVKYSAKTKSSKQKSAIINDTLVEPKIHKFACKICSATLSCDYNLKRHISEVHQKVKYSAKRKSSKPLSTYASICKFKENNDCEVELLHSSRQKLNDYENCNESLDKHAGHNTFSQTEYTGTKLKRKKKFTCEKCKATLSCEYNLRRHLSEVHEGVKYYAKKDQKIRHRTKLPLTILPCTSEKTRDFCESEGLPKNANSQIEEGTDTRKDMSYHQLSKKEHVKAFTCEICDVTLCGDYNLRRHVSKVHKGVKYCAKKNSLVTKHSEQPSHIYEAYKEVWDCPKEKNSVQSKTVFVSDDVTSRSETNLNELQKEDLKGQTKYDNNEHSFKTQSQKESLRKSVKQGKQKYPRKELVCELCRMKCIDLRCLRQHMITMHGVRNTKAIKKEKLLVTGYNRVTSVDRIILKRKKKIGERPTETNKYSCPKCGIKLHDTFRLKRHILEVHEKIRIISKKNYNRLKKQSKINSVGENLLQDSRMPPGCSRNSQNSRYSEIRCEEKVKASDHFMVHYLEVLTVKDQYLCDLCNTVCRTLTDLMSHVEQHVFGAEQPRGNEDSKLISEKQENCDTRKIIKLKGSNVSPVKKETKAKKCKYCGLKVAGSTQTAYYIKRHLLQVHQGIKLDRAHGQSISFAVKRIDDPNVQKLVHLFPQVKLTKCPKCEIPFGSYTFLENHMDKFHDSRLCDGSENGSLQHDKRENEKTHIGLQHKHLACNKCDEKIENISDIKKHYYGSHMKESVRQVWYRSCLKRIKKRRYMYLSTSLSNLKTISKMYSHMTSHITMNHHKHKTSYKRVRHFHKKQTDGSMEDKKGRLKLYTCKFCQKRLSNIDKYRKHVTLHAGKMMYTCFACQKAFLCQKYLIQHMNTHTHEHTVTILYKCEPCGKQFATEYHYRRHMESAIHFPGRFLCDVCSKTFKTAARLSNHQKGHGEQKYESMCPICGAGFVRNYSLNRHFLVHSLKKPFSCSQCPMSFKVKYELVRHKITHNSNRERSFHCKMCSKAFFTQGLLNKHHRTVHSEKNHACCICEKCFATESDLKTHKKIHSDERSEICELCGKSFRLRTHLRAHLRMHKGEKLWGCEKCGIRYTDKRSYTRHIGRCNGPL